MFALLLRWLLRLLFLPLLALLCGGLALWIYLEPKLPAIDALSDTRMQVPLRIFSADGLLMGEFGEVRRSPVRIESIPKPLIQAFLAAEDARFYDHSGVDFRGLTRAATELLRTGQKQSGASTITMQLPRNFAYLGREATYERKLKEILLALKIERHLSKDQILELYLNKIELGHRAHGVGAAAYVYYGKQLDELSLAEIAMIAGLPKAPSRDNPIRNPARALERRNYVLSRMLEVRAIDQASFAAALAEPDRAFLREPAVELNAPWLSEMVRAEMVQRFGADAAYGDGLVVRTTVNSRWQVAAEAAVAAQMDAYDRRHGWRGAEAQVAVESLIDPESCRAELASRPNGGALVAAGVMEVDESEAWLCLADGRQILLGMDAMRWARPYLDENRRGPAPQKANEVVSPGDVVRVALDSDGSWQLAQIPKVQGALSAVDTSDGAIRALVGGYRFTLSKFNRAVQSQRQPGSSFKPFVYAVAFDKGFGPASIVNDAPVIYAEPGMAQAWRPSNDGGSFSGPIRLREAMVTSRNLVSVRLLQSIGVGHTIEALVRFGFPERQLPENLSLALGAGGTPPLVMAEAYAMLANGGRRVTSYLVSEVIDGEGQLRYRANPPRVCADCVEPTAQSADRASIDADEELAATEQIPELLAAPQVLDERTAFLIRSLLRDVIQRGTGRGARVLERTDIGGKTGTTNDYRDAWFSGFHPQLAVTAWSGFDDFSSLGNGEFGSRAALPMWIDFMRVALADLPEVIDMPPPGVTTAWIDPNSGRLSAARSGGALQEFFLEEFLPLTGSIGASEEDPELRSGGADPFGG